MIKLLKTFKTYGEAKVFDTEAKMYESITKRPSKAKFNRVAYQREYMRKRRAKQT